DTAGYFQISCSRRSENPTSADPERKSSQVAGSGVSENMYFTPFLLANMPPGILSGDVNMVIPSRSNLLLPTVTTSVFSAKESVVACARIPPIPAQAIG